MRKLLLFLLLLPTIVFAQGTATNIRNGSTLPTACANGDIFYKTSGTIGVYECTTPGNPGTWTHIPYSVSNITALFSGCSGTAYLGFDGACHTAVGSPAGSDKYCQFNDGGVFGGESNCQWDKTNHQLNLGNGSTQMFMGMVGGAGAPSPAGPILNACYQYFDTTAGYVKWGKWNGTNLTSVSCSPPAGSGTVTNTGTLTSGSLMVGNGGVDSNVLASDPTNCSAGNAPTGIDKTGAAKGCASISGGSAALVLVEQHTASSSATLNFTTGITSTYDDYLLVFDHVVPATNGVDALVLVSTDGGSTWQTSSYSGQTQYMYSGGSAAGPTSTANIQIAGATASRISNNANRGISGTYYFYNPLTTSGYKVMDGRANYFDTTTSTLVRIETIGEWQSTTAVNAIQFKFSSGNISSGTIRLYGISK